MGRPRKPVAHHKKTGLLRQDRHGNCDLTVEVPPMPGDLSGAAAAMWNVTAEHVRFAGVVARVDGAALRTLCVAWSIYLDAVDDIDANGITITEYTADGFERKKINPAIRVQDTAWKQVMKGLTQFGLTPASRNGIRKLSDGGGDAEENDRIAQILGLGSSN